MCNLEETKKLDKIELKGNDQKPVGNLRHRTAGQRFPESKRGQARGGLKLETKVSRTLKPSESQGN